MREKYLLLDTMNSYFRALHVTRPSDGIDIRVGYAIHVTLQSMAAAWREQNATHLVVALEGHSWRKEFYTPYKANREVKRMASTVKEQEESAAFMEGYAHLVTFLSEHTNATVLQHAQLEADDMIAGWIQTHTEDEHIILSSDSDFHQLLAENVTQYNGVAKELHTVDGIFDYKGKHVIDKKTKLPKTIPDPAFILFEKILRGDPTDNIFSAYPGVRTKGSKNKVGINEAFADRHNKGFNYNNLMLQRWVDHNGVEHRVLDDFKRNEILVDLSAQPDDIRAILLSVIKESAVAKSIPMIGVRFLKFCGKHELTKLSDQASTYTNIFNASYKEKL
jgi:5'-3' exonuclease